MVQIPINTLCKKYDKTLRFLHQTYECHNISPCRLKSLIKITIKLGKASGMPIQYYRAIFNEI